MKSIPPHIVEQTALTINQMENEAEIERLIDQIGEEQPFILAYLMGMGDGDFDEDEREIFLFIGLVIWKVMRGTASILPPVTEENLEAVRHHNMQMLEYLAKESEEGFIQVAQQLLREYNQPAILQYVMDVIMEEKEAEVIREENQGIMIIFLKIVIDCFDQNS